MEMENPNTWDEVTRLIDMLIREHNASTGEVGLSEAAFIQQGLEKAGFLRPSQESEVHVVYGCTGAFEDYIEWAIAAYFNKTDAEEHANKAANRAKEIFDTVGYSGWAVGANEFDPEGLFDYTGTSYSVGTIPLKQ